MAKKNIFSPERVQKYDYLITKEQPLSYITESFQKVLINLDYANLDGNHKVIQFTSTLASEGKSTFVSNMAYLLGKKGKKVILLDLDFRKPKLNRVFNSTNREGLTDYLSGKIQFDRMVRHSDEVGIDYIVAGEKTTSIVNVLDSLKLKELIATLKSTYDYVLLDTPPVIAVSDALYVSRLADGVIFIVAQNTAKKTLVKDAINTLKNNHVTLLGIVLTQVNMKSGAYGYGYDYSYKYE